MINKMKNAFCFFILFYSLFASAQEKSFRCFFSENNNNPNSKNPQPELNRQALEKFTREFIAHEHLQRSSSTPIYRIPVVFHVLHNYGPENISKAQIIDCVNALNDDFQKRSADTIDIVPSFQSIAADCQIEFRLTSIDPNGNCTDGIERIATTKTYLATDNSKVNRWPNNNYVNFWVAASLLNSAAGVQVTPPGGPDSLDGILLRSDFVGRIGTGSIVNSRSLTHNMGHFFNLIHVWGSINTPGLACGDDLVSDTPISIGWDHCDLTGSVCNPPIIENVQNFMEESYCTRMFTQGQCARMHAALNSPLNGRNNLWTTNNLIAAGTTGSPVNICSPVADFYASPINACTGTPVVFADQSWNSNITSWNWSFPGGNPTTSIDTNPTVVYSTPGIYGATLIVTSANGSDSISKTASVRISDTAMISMNYTNDFENVVTFPGVDGWIESTDTIVANNWRRVNNANTTTSGSNSIKIDNYSNPAGLVDSWVTPSINFSNVGFPIVMTFMVANAQRNSSTYDKLTIQYSVNCGKTWINTSYNKQGMSLSTAGIVNTSFLPATLNQWRQETVKLNPVQHQPNVRFRFTNTSDNGNNTFIDDINIIGTPTSIDENNYLNSDIAVFPNPSKGNTTISFSLVKSCNVNIDVKNILGQTIVSLPHKLLNEGFHENKISNLSPGIYIIDVVINGRRVFKKLVVS